MLSAISEPVVGAAVVRSYAVEDRTQARIDEAIDEYKAASTRAQQFTVVSFSLGGISAGLANAGRAHRRHQLARASRGDMTAGTVLAFAFLVTLFVGPVQMGTQILTDAQNAMVSWRRVIGILETPADLVDPGPDGAGAAARPDRRPVRRRHVRLPRRSAGAARHRPRHRRRHPGGGRRRDRLRQVDDRQAADPADGPVEGAVLLDGIDVREIAQDVAAPQRGAGAAGGLPLRRHHRRQRPLRTARTRPTEEILASADELGLGDWLAGLPAGLETQVGQRGESLSAGERQLVALLRAQLADPDLLVLDEATSAVDPALEMRIGRALERLMSGRTVGHHRPPALHRRERRRGRGRRPGPHRPARPARGAGAEEGSVYAGLHASWVRAS